MNFDIFSMLQRSANPQQFIMQYLTQNQQNPMFANILQLAQQGRGDEIEKIARNLCASRGLDFDKEFNAFRSRLGR